ncbi:MAG: TadE/TadG family type IV pilus assembly protein [Actinomycetota bacterium]
MTGHRLPRSGRAAGSGWAGQAGQATVELVLALPVVLLALLAVLQVGLVVNDRLLVAHAAREGARAAAVEPSDGAATAAASAATWLDPDRLTVVRSGGTDPGDRVTIRVEYRSPTGVPLVGHLVGDVIVSSTVTMRVE